MPDADVEPEVLGVPGPERGLDVERVAGRAASAEGGRSGQEVRPRRPEGGAARRVFTESTGVNVNCGRPATLSRCRVMDLLAQGNGPDPELGRLPKVEGAVERALRTSAAVSVEATGAWDSDWQLTSDLEGRGHR